MRPSIILGITSAYLGRSSMEGVQVGLRIVASEKFDCTTEIARWSFHAGANDSHAKRQAGSSGEVGAEERDRDRVEVRVERKFAVIAERHQEFSSGCSDGALDPRIRNLIRGLGSLQEVEKCSNPSRKDDAEPKPEGFDSAYVWFPESSAAAEEVRKHRCALLRRIAR
ncbi:MAG TPA: hypothetical protein VHR72_12550 [Gemmataceae bacterium]|nr:hypothetical protein [Gemmataceae bacterium]